MRQLSQNELAEHAQNLQDLLDAKVQQIFVSDRGLGLALYKNSQINILWFEMQAPTPCMLLFNEIPNFFKLKKTSPLFLFLKAHLIEKRLSELQHLKEWGRVIEFQFGYDEILKLEVRLIPHRANIIVNFQGKKISLEKVQTLEKFENKIQEDAIEIRDLTQFTKQWLESQNKNRSTSVDPTLLKEKEIQKKQKVLSKIEEQIHFLENDLSKKLGDWLKTHQSLEVPKEFAEHIDRSRSFSWNLQHFYEKAKKVKEKLKGTLERKKELEHQIAAIKTADLKQFQGELPERSTHTKKEAPWRGHRFSLNDRVEVFVGRNATENLQILRYAQSWDLWLHLKDYPGAHGIIRRPRNLQVSDDEIKKVARFVAAKSKKSAHFLKVGDNFEVICAQCRYVRPIKGDKLGRVTYSNARTFLCSF